MPPGLVDITITPAVATKIAAIIGQVTVSPRNTRPNTATWIGSVLIYAMVTTNERSPMAASIKAVAATCAKAPSITHGQKVHPGRGNGTLVTNMITARKTSAKGKPNRKRTWVAPTVPSVTVSSRCMALRRVWAKAAIMVKTAQSQGGDVTYAFSATSM